MDKSALRVQTITRAEVRVHNQPDDLWMVIYNKIYNLTDFALIHPGGPEMLFECAGLDATLEFEDVGHSSVAMAMLHPYEKGRLPAHESKEYFKTTGKDGSKKSRKTKKGACRSRRGVPCLIGAAIMSLVTILLLQREKWVQIST